MRTFFRLMSAWRESLLLVAVIAVSMACFIPCRTVCSMWLERDILKLSGEKVSVNFVCIYFLQGFSVKEFGGAVYNS